MTRALTLLILLGGATAARAEDGYELWRNYRLRRDLMGEGADPSLAEELAREDGVIPSDYRDRALERALEYLREDAARRAAAEDAEI